MGGSAPPNAEHPSLDSVEVRAILDVSVSSSNSRGKGQAPLADCRERPCFVTTHGQDLAPVPSSATALGLAQWGTVVCLLGVFLRTGLCTISRILTARCTVNPRHRKPMRRCALPDDWVSECESPEVLWHVGPKTRSCRNHAKSWGRTPWVLQFSLRVNQGSSVGVSVYLTGTAARVFSSCRMWWGCLLKLVSIAPSYPLDLELNTARVPD